mmetsp:Transcript_26366/g.54291  ORF Transcript_26366/g.54291 Transcript_26366/m.54291 type:complete len:311 (+) Transcript_26366:502-1434(+)
MNFSPRTSLDGRILSLPNVTLGLQAIDFAMRAAPTATQPGLLSLVLVMVLMLPLELWLLLRPRATGIHSSDSADSWVLKVGDAGVERGEGSDDPTRSCPLISPSSATPSSREPPHQTAPTRTGSSSDGCSSAEPPHQTAPTRTGFSSDGCSSSSSLTSLSFISCLATSALTSLISNSSALSRSSYSVRSFSMASCASCAAASAALARANAPSSFSCPPSSSSSAQFRTERMAGWMGRATGCSTASSSAGDSCAAFTSSRAPAVTLGGTLSTSWGARAWPKPGSDSKSLERAGMSRPVRRWSHSSIDAPFE